MNAALIFYSFMDPLNRQTRAARLMEYCEEIYPEILNDYIHIMESHPNDIDRMVMNVRRDMDLMDLCSFTNCVKVRRHYRNRVFDEP